jgi:hypothetical protein
MAINTDVCKHKEESSKTLVAIKSEQGVTSQQTWIFRIYIHYKHTAALLHCCTAALHQTGNNSLSLMVVAATKNTVM